MSYLCELIEDRKQARLIAGEREPIGPHFAPDVVDRVARLELWATTASDPGEWIEFRALDLEGHEIARRRLEGY